MRCCSQREPLACSYEALGAEADAARDDGRPAPAQPRVDRRCAGRQLVLEDD